MGVGEGKERAPEGRTQERGWHGPSIIMFGADQLQRLILTWFLSHSVTIHEASSFTVTEYINSNKTLPKIRER